MKKKHKRTGFSFIFVPVLLIAFYFVFSRFFLHASWIAALGSSRNIGIIMFRASLVPLFALVFSTLAVIHSHLGTAGERHNKNFLTFKFFFFFFAALAAESFLRITESTIYAVMAGPVGVSDVLFNIDFSWYLFWIPLIKNLSLFLTCYFILLFVFRISYPGYKKIAYGKISLSLFSLFSVIFLLIAYSQYLSEKRMATPDPFLGYSDIFGHLLPLAASLLWTWFFLTLCLFIFKRQYKLMFTGGIFTFFVLLFCNLVWPFYLNEFIFSPNKTMYQNKFAGIHAENTRRAFGLADLKKDQKAVPLVGDPSINLSSYFLLDNEVFLKQIQNTQDFHNTFSFKQVYPAVLGDTGRPYYVSARTLNYISSDWEVKYFRDVFGYGAVIAAASSTDKNGAPAYSLQGLGLKGDFPLDKPEIFFAENFEGFSFINTKMPLPSYDKESATFEEKVFLGVQSISVNFLHKLALAFSEKDMRYILTKYYTPDTKLLYSRKPSELAKTILPYFDYDNPRLIYFNKQLWWEMDGYSSSPNVFIAAPIDTPWGKKNWLSAPIRAYVSAYSGEVFFRRINTEEPFVRVISKIFPKLFAKDIGYNTEMYPETLFRVQSKLLEKYHEMDPATFYAGQNDRVINENSVPMPLIVTNKNGRYTLALGQEYSLKGKKQSAAYLISFVDADGAMVQNLYKKNMPINDAEQAFETLKADEGFQNLSTLWKGLNITPIFGRMKFIPIENGGVHVQAIYTNSLSLNMPVLAKTALVKEQTVSFVDNLSQLSPLLVGADSASEITLTREETLSNALRDIYLYYLEAEKNRVEGNTQDYQKNVDKIGEMSYQALN